jgi:hypothetical protein
MRAMEREREAQKHRIRIISRRLTKPCHMHTAGCTLWGRTLCVKMYSYTSAYALRACYSITLQVEFESLHSCTHVTPLGSTVIK